MTRLTGWSYIMVSYLSSTERWPTRASHRNPNRLIARGAMRQAHCRYSIVEPCAAALTGVNIIRRAGTSMHSRCGATRAFMLASVGAP
jgi:hypothetical protein